MEGRTLLHPFVTAAGEVTSRVEIHVTVKRSTVRLVLTRGERVFSEPAQFGYGDKQVLVGAVNSVVPLVTVCSVVGGVDKPLLGSLGKCVATLVCYGCGGVLDPVSREKTKECVARHFETPNCKGRNYFAGEERDAVCHAFGENKIPIGNAAAGAYRLAVVSPKYANTTAALATGVKGLSAPPPGAAASSSAAPEAPSASSAGHAEPNNDNNNHGVLGECVAAKAKLCGNCMLVSKGGKEETARCTCDKHIRQHEHEHEVLDARELRLAYIVGVDAVENAARRMFVVAPIDSAQLAPKVFEGFLARAALHDPHSFLATYAYSPELLAVVNTNTCVRKALDCALQDNVEWKESAAALFQQQRRVRRTAAPAPAPSRGVSESVWNPLAAPQHVASSHPKSQPQPQSQSVDAVLPSQLADAQLAVSACARGKVAAVAQQQLNLVRQTRGPNAFTQGVLTQSPNLVSHVFSNMRDEAASTQAYLDIIQATCPSNSSGARKSSLAALGTALGVNGLDPTYLDLVHDSLRAVSSPDTAVVWRVISKVAESMLDLMSRAVSIEPVVSSRMANAQSEILAQPRGGPAHGDGEFKAYRISALGPSTRAKYKKALSMLFFFAWWRTRKLREANMVSLELAVLHDAVESVVDGVGEWSQLDEREVRYSSYVGSFVAALAMFASFRYGNGGHVAASMVHLVSVLLAVKVEVEQSTRGFGSASLGSGGGGVGRRSINSNSNNNGDGNGSREGGGEGHGEDEHDDEEQEEQEEEDDEPQQPQQVGSASHDGGVQRAHVEAALKDLGALSRHPQVIADAVASFSWFLKAALIVSALKAMHASNLVNPVCFQDWVDLAGHSSALAEAHTLLVKAKAVLESVKDKNALRTGAAQTNDEGVLYVESHSRVSPAALPLLYLGLVERAQHAIAGMLGGGDQAKTFARAFVERGAVKSALFAPNGRFAYASDVLLRDMVGLVKTTNKVDLVSSRNDLLGVIASLFVLFSPVALRQADVRRIAFEPVLGLPQTAYLVGMGGELYVQVATNATKNGAHFNELVSPFATSLMLLVTLLTEESAVGTEFVENAVMRATDLLARFEDGASVDLTRSLSTERAKQVAQAALRSLVFLDLSCVPCNMSKLVAAVAEDRGMHSGSYFDKLVCVYLIFDVSKLSRIALQCSVLAAQGVVEERVPSPQQTFVRAALEGTTFGDLFDNTNGRKLAEHCKVSKGKHVEQFARTGTGVLVGSGSSSIVLGWKEAEQLIEDAQRGHHQATSSLSSAAAQACHSVSTSVATYGAQLARVGTNQPVPELVFQDRLLAAARAQISTGVCLWPQSMWKCLVSMVPAVDVGRWLRTEAPDVGAATLGAAGESSVGSHRGHGPPHFASFGTVSPRPAVSSLGGARTSSPLQGSLLGQLSPSSSPSSPLDRAAAASSSPLGEEEETQEVSNVFDSPSFSSGSGGGAAGVSPSAETPTLGQRDAVSGLREQLSSAPSLLTPLPSHAAAAPVDGLPDALDEACGFNLDAYEAARSFLIRTRKIASDGRGCSVFRSGVVRDAAFHIGAVCAAFRRTLAATTATTATTEVISARLVMLRQLFAARIVPASGFTCAPRSPSGGPDKPAAAR